MRNMDTVKEGSERIKIKQGEKLKKKGVISKKEEVGKTGINTTYKEITKEIEL
jgi:hypothetical protein